jgi:histidinol-phosphate/aromatic aminotransferase/cobyric acid decarboxylase-like protein
MGMPGLRLGYAYSSNTAFNDFVKKSLPIWNLNSIAEYYMEIALKHRKSLSLSFSNTLRDRETFKASLCGLSCVEKVFDSAANFLLISMKSGPHRAAGLAESLLSRYSIYVKDISHKFSDGRGYLRLAVRLPHENAMIVKCIKELD